MFLLARKIYDGYTGWTFSKKDGDFEHKKNVYSILLLLFLADDFFRIYIKVFSRLFVLQVKVLYLYL